MFASKARSLPYSEAPERYFTCVCVAALFANNKLGWKDLPRTNTLAQYEYL
jgi:hypothetical protein